MAGRKGRSGRKPIPTNVKQLKGTLNKSRENARTKGREEVAFPVTALSPPAYLDDVASAEWRRLYPILDKVKILTEPDLHQLAQYCEALSLCIAARKEYKREGLTIQNELTGVMRPHPMIAVAEKAARTMLNFAVEFGLTPAARSRVLGGNKPGDGDKGDDDEQFMFHPPKLELVK